MSEIENPILPNVIVITPSIGHKDLERAIKSVQDQDYLNVEHLIVADGPMYKDKVNSIVSKYFNKNTTVYFTTLPYNTGRHRWNGHRIYGSFPMLMHHSDLVCYLDEDNYFDTNHISSLVQTMVNTKSDWVYSLRKIIDQNGNFVCDDNCESLGDLSPVWNNSNDYLIDTSCYMIKRPIAIIVGQVWNKPTRPPKPLMEPDRELFKVLKENWKNFHCSKEYTLNYATGNRSDSVKSEFFVAGNKATSKIFGNKPTQVSDKVPSVTKEQSVTQEQNVTEVPNIVEITEVPKIVEITEEPKIVEITEEQSVTEAQSVTETQNVTEAQNVTDEQSVKEVPKIVEIVERPKQYLVLP
jgi:glycosyltransferase involved in cell wall biosynthesis